MLTTVEHEILTVHGLTRQHLEQVLHSMMQTQLDYADLYFQVKQHASVSLEEGIVKDADFSIDHGVGVRAVCGEKTGFAYSDDIDLPALHAAAKTARSIAALGGQGQVHLAPRTSQQGLYGQERPWGYQDEAMWVSVLQQADQLARSLDPRIQQVMVGLAAEYDMILLAASDGTYCADIRPLVRMNVTVIAEEHGRREQGFAGGGGRYSCSELLQEGTWQGFVREAVRIATVNLSAVAAPAGTMDVVLGAGWPGVLLHEAVGHGLEGDFNRKGLSAFSSLLGQSVASPLCTVVDDGTLAGRRGSLTIDDEGTPTEYTVLIEQGCLKGYMQDKLNARLMNTRATGNARRESYAHLPMPRMTNTYMLPGAHNPGEIIASIDRGLYAVNFSGGQVDITSGKYVFAANEAYWVENGKIQYPVKGATLIGDGPTALHKITMVGNDLALDTGIGVCGKDGQSVPVGVGMPTIRINGLTVGGSRAYARD